MGSRLTDECLEGARVVGGEEAEGMWEMKLWWEPKQETMMSRFEKRAVVTSEGTGCWSSCLEFGS